MFELTIPTSIVLAVDVRPPEGAGVPGACTVDVRYLSHSERMAYVKRIAGESLTDSQILDEMLIGWDGITDEEGVRLEFNDAAVRRRVLDVPWVYDAVLDAVLRELRLGDAAAKNS